MNLFNNSTTVASNTLENIIKSRYHPSTNCHTTIISSPTSITRHTFSVSIALIWAQHKLEHPGPNDFQKRMDFGYIETQHSL